MKEWKLDTTTPADLHVSRSEFETLARLVDRLGERINEQARTIETQSKRIDQVQQRPSILIDGKPLQDCTDEEIDAALSRMMFRP